MTLQAWIERTPVGMRKAFMHAMNLYPPFVGAGIRIAAVAPDMSAFDVELRQLPWTRNFVGTHFGGSIYAMCDPFFMVALATQLGPEYLVWDKTAEIRFLRPGRGTLRARFAVTPEQVAQIRADVAAGGKCEPTFDSDVIGPSGEVIASVHKRLWVKRKAPRPTTSPTEPSHVQPTA